MKFSIFTPRRRHAVFLAFVLFTVLTSISIWSWWNQRQLNQFIVANRLDITARRISSHLENILQERLNDLNLLKVIWLTHTKEDRSHQFKELAEVIINREMMFNQISFVDTTDTARLEINARQYGKIPSQDQQHGLWTSESEDEARLDLHNGMPAVRLNSKNNELIVRIPCISRKSNRSIGMITGSLHLTGIIQRILSQVLDEEVYLVIQIDGLEIYNSVPGRKTDYIPDSASRSTHFQRDILQRSWEIEVFPASKFVSWDTTTAMRTEILNNVVLAAIIALLVGFLIISIHRIRESELRFSHLVRNLNDGLYVLNDQGDFMDVNPAAQNMLGYTLSELQRMQVDDLTTHNGQLTPQQRNILWSEGGRMEIAQRRKDGSLIDVELSVAPISLGQEKRIIAIVRDVTERNLAAASLENSERKFRTFFNSIDDAVFIHQPTGQILEANQVAITRYGYQLSDLKQMTALQLESPEERCRYTERAETLYERQHLTFETVHLTRSGDRFHVEINSSLIIYDGASVVLSVARDIQRRKQVEEQLYLLSSTVEQSTEAFVITDKNGLISFANRTVEKLYLYSLDELIGRSLFELNADHEISSKIQDSIHASGYWSGELLQQRKDGTPFLAQLALYTVRNVAANITGVAAVIRDITEQKKAEQELRIKDFAIKSSISAIGLADLDGIILDVNDSFLHLWEYGHKQDILGRHIQEFGDGELILALQQQVHQKGSAIGEGKIYTNTGKRVEVKYLVSTVFDEEHKSICLMASFIDISEAKQTEMALRESEYRFRTLIQQASDAIFVTDYDGNFILVNERAATSLQYGVQELMNMKISDIDNSYFSQDHISFSSDSFKVGIPREFESQHRRRDGSVFPVDVSIVLLETESGQFWLSIARDITDRKMAEEKIQKSLQEKKVLLKEIHHRVKNNLAVMSSLLGLQIEHVHTREEAQGALQKSRDRIYAMAQIHTMLYQTEDFSGIHFAQYIDSMVSNLLYIYSRVRKVEIQKDMADTYFEITLAVPLGLIINELVTNALKHTFTEDDNMGKIVISLRPDSTEGMILQISDNGPGLPAEVDVKNPESLGLQLVMLLTEQIRGSIEMIQEQGTQFTIRFDPISDRSH